MCKCPYLAACHQTSFTLSLLQDSGCDHSHFSDVEFTTHGSTTQCEFQVVLGNALRQLFKHLQGAHMCGVRQKRVFPILN